VAADLSNIELRLALAMCRQHDKLALIRNGADLYCDFASKLYNQPVTKANIVPRKVGKAGVLSCIAEGQFVMTDAGPKTIEHVGLKDKVWDGVEFVNHGGVEFMGVKQVISYDGLTATPDHRVLTGGTKQEWRQFGRVAKSKLRIARGHVRTDWPAVWRLDEDLTGTQGARTYDIINCGPRQRFCVNNRVVHNCQYGTGGATFQNMLYAQAGVIEDLEFCTRVVKTYRSDFDKVSGAWKELDRQIIAMAAGQLRTPEIDGPMIWKTDRVIMPSGFALKYPQIRPSPTERGYCYLRRSHKNAARGGFDTIWGATLLENLAQALGAQVIMYYAKVVYDLTGIRVSHQVHDELIWMVNEKDAENFRRVVSHVMHQAPVWWDSLDLAAEANVGISYGDV
jgi:hypothetical protein